MKRIRVTVRTNISGSETSRVIEIDDNATDEEIQEVAEETKNEMIEWYYEEIE